MSCQAKLTFHVIHLFDNNITLLVTCQRVSYQHLSISASISVSSQSNDPNLLDFADSEIIYLGEFRVIVMEYWLIPITISQW